MFVLYFADGLPSEGRITFLFLCTLFTHIVFKELTLCLKRHRPYKDNFISQLVLKYILLLIESNDPTRLGTKTSNENTGICGPAYSSCIFV